MNMISAGAKLADNYKLSAALDRFFKKNFDPLTTDEECVLAAFINRAKDLEKKYITMLSFIKDLYVLESVKFPNYYYHNINGKLTVLRDIKSSTALWSEKEALDFLLDNPDFKKIKVSETLYYKDATKLV